MAVNLNTEPTALIGAFGEMLRQILPALVVIGVVSWDDKTMAGIFMLTSGVLTFLTIVFY